VIPKDLSDRHSAWSWEVAYHFNPGHPTYRLRRGGRTRFLKLNPSGSSIADEAQRLRWAAGYLPVPALIEYGSDGDYDWLLTEGLPGRDATRLLGEPRALVIALGEGMRALHETVPAAQCPFDFTAMVAVEHVRGRFKAGLISPETDFHAEHAHLTAEQAVDLLDAMAPRDEHPVVCHGDFSFPNVLLESGGVTGYVDLGSLGVADPWMDLAACALSCDFNLGPGWVGLLLEAYGIAPDPERLAWFKLLYDLR
jgi:kanamycin kinase